MSLQALRNKLQQAKALDESLTTGNTGEYTGPSSNWNTSLLEPRKTWINTSISDVTHPSSTSHDDKHTNDISQTQLSDNTQPGTTQYNGTTKNMNTADIGVELEQKLTGPVLKPPKLVASTPSTKFDFDIDLKTPIGSVRKQKLTEGALKQKDAVLSNLKRERNLSNSSDEALTDPAPTPFDVRGLFKAPKEPASTSKLGGLRHSFSTPDCKSASIGGTFGSEKRKLNLGKPMRVLKSSLPQLREGHEDKDEHLTDIKPLPPSKQDDSPLLSHGGPSKIPADSPNSDSGIQTQTSQSIDFSKHDTNPLNNCNVNPQSTYDLNPHNNYGVQPQRNYDTKPQNNYDLNPQNSYELKPQSSHSTNRGQSNSCVTPDNHAPKSGQALGLNPSLNAVNTRRESVPMEIDPFRRGSVPMDVDCLDNRLKAIHVLGAEGESNKGFGHNPSPLAAPIVSPLAVPLPTQPSPVPLPQAELVVAPVPIPQAATSQGRDLSQHQLVVNKKAYTVLQIVGRGGSSKVYRVVDPDSKKLLAIKYVDLNEADRQTIDGYKNEIALLHRLGLKNSDKIIKMFDYQYQKEKNCLMVVMEHGDTDLASLFKSRTKKGEISVEMRRFYWSEMLQAVAVLHQEGIVHSDLKPANFLLVAGNLKLIDFGIANAIQQDKTSVIRDTQVGTLNYMSPEAIMDTCENGPQVDSNGQMKPRIKIGTKSDVWSLGVILYHMAYGKTPFQHIRNSIAKLQAIINPQFKIEFQDLPDRHLVDVMKKCLHRDVKERPTVDELLRHPYLQGEQRDSTPEKPSGITTENFQHLLKDIINSPNSLSAVSQGLLQQGTKFDVVSFLKNRHLARVKEGPSPICPPEFNISPSSDKEQTGNMMVDEDDDL
ncbi:unnamed protein product [Owenia fusiformis]|uniref:Uncharacterized protein n=1 Tax=Owenia fusiformis TaxID=6347 RepID=A0A8J1XIH8_OWEFU|nr:unnamed protein product [Owenia fusiformis]